MPQGAPSCSSLSLWDAWDRKAKEFISVVCVSTGEIFIWGIILSKGHKMSLFGCFPSNTFFYFPFQLLSVFTSAAGFRVLLWWFGERDALNPSRFVSVKNLQSQITAYIHRLGIFFSPYRESYEQRTKEQRYDTKTTLIFKVFLFFCIRFCVKRLKKEEI